MTVAARSAPITIAHSHPIHTPATPPDSSFQSFPERRFRIKKPGKNWVPWQPKALGPNDRPGIALVGCGGQGRGDCAGAAAHGDIIAVCDVDDSHADAAAKQFTKNGKVPEKYNDFRKLMERDDVHAIITGTPDHWHTFVNMLAVKTGKDVYTEKPLTLTIDEGKRLVTVRQHSAPS